MTKVCQMVLTGTLAVGVALICPTTKALGQNITLDGTLGTTGTLTGPNYQIPQSVGQAVGNNLFHSFGKFNLNANEAAIFESADNIRNILSRVTGGSPSSIDGLIRTLGSNVNLFLINPSGIIFGENARLDVGGSFVASTANAIQFGNQGFFSATNPQPPSPLLTIDSSALFFNQLQAGKIESKSTAPAADNLFGIRVPDGRSLLLVGGDITIDGGRLNALGGRLELTGLAGDGTVGLNVDGNNLSLSVPDDVVRADVSIINGATIDVSAGGGGSITVNAKNLEVTQGSQLLAGIREGLGTPQAQAGNITINATDSVLFDNQSFTFNDVNFGGVGNAGDVSVTTGSLEVTNGARLTSDILGKGDAGSVTINATNKVKFDGSGKDGISGAFSRVFTGGVGNAGSVSITTDSLEILNGAQLNTTTSGVGNAGRITIRATDSVKFDGSDKDGMNNSGAFSIVGPRGVGRAGGVSITTSSLQVLNGTQLNASTFGVGNAGSITINAIDSVKFNGESKNGVKSAAVSQVEARAVGNAGGVFITTGSLEALNGAAFSTSTKGKGDAGSVTIRAADFVKFDGKGKDGFSGAFTRVETGGVGNAGDVSITTDSLEVLNGAFLSASTRGKGDAGSVTIRATDFVKFDGEISTGAGVFGALSQVDTKAVGNAGGVSITTGSLEVLNGAQLDASTFGFGNAGSITINATDSVKFDGKGDIFNSAAGSSVQRGATGNAGGVSITTGSLQVLNGAFLTANTLEEGDTGNITIIANSFEASKGGKVSTATSGRFPAGNINLKVRDSITLSGSETGIFANTTLGSTGKGGNIIIDPRTLTIRDGATIAVDSQGEAIGGDIQLAAGFLTLDKGTISAQTRSNTGGNITLNLQDLLLLRNGSQISTTAGNDQFGGDGGNITINTPFIVAVPKENSDITANAFTGKGGRINITTNGIFGIVPQERLTGQSDITASSQLGVSGQVTINTPDVDPSRGLIELPANLVDASQQIAQGCTPRGGDNTSRFISTGRGGLPLSPNQPLRGRAVITNWVDLPLAPADRRTDKLPTVSVTKSTPKIVEAQKIVVDKNGDILLVAQSPQSSSSTPSRELCGVSLSPSSIQQRQKNSGMSA